MLKKSGTCVVVMTSLCAATLCVQMVENSSAGDRRRSRTASTQVTSQVTSEDQGTPKDDSGPPPSGPQYVYNPANNVSVDPTLQLDAGTEATYQQMAAVLNKSTFVPNDRSNYYSAYASSQSEAITGWGSFVTSVQQNDQGYLVTIFITPGIFSSNAGPCAVPTGGNYSEQYQVSNGQVTYVGALDPDGTAGQYFPVIGL